MKAEQRKELETNTLADKMGQAMQRVKASPRRTFFTYFIVAAVAVVVLWVGYRWWTGDVAERSQQWVIFYDGSHNFIESLAKDPVIRQSPVGKSARFQKAWFNYWDEGIKMIGMDQRGAIASLKNAREAYRELATDCKEDKVFLPQALLGIAVTEESLAIQDRTHLDEAKKLYEKLIEDHKETGEAKFARERLEYFKDDGKRAELAATYKDMQTMLRIQAPLAPPPRGFEDIFNQPK